MKDDRLISLNAAIDALNKKWRTCIIGESLIRDAGDTLKALPPAQPVNIAKLQPNCNQIASDCISRQAAVKALEETKQSDPFNRYEYQNIGIDWSIDAIKALPSAQPGWIPCKTALPSEYDSYLITTEDGKVVFGVYDPREQQWCRYDSIQSRWLDGIKVVAWCELLTPYREGGQS